MKILLGLLVSLGLTGCVIDRFYGPPPANFESGIVEYCDDWGCRYIDAPHYYSGDDVIYWDAELGVWVGPHAYWDQDHWHPGVMPGYHHRYDHFRHERHERYEHHEHHERHEREHR